VSLTVEDLNEVTRLLGREPRGLNAVVIRRASNSCSAVLQVASLVDDKPFPTLFWLVDPELNHAIDRLEAMGLILQWQNKLDHQPTYRQRLAEDHRAYIQLRWDLMKDEDRRRIYQLGFEAVLKKRGIGGIADFGRIRCLHTYYAAHLVKANLIGEWLDAYWQEQDTAFANKFTLAPMLRF
jgi:hypothetical protein